MAESYDSSISRFLIIPYLKYVDYISRLCFKENLYNFFKIVGTYQVFGNIKLH